MGQDGRLNTVTDAQDDSLGLSKIANVNCFWGFEY